MDMPNFKDLLQRLSIFKSNISLLVSTILAVVGVLILVLTPLLMGSKLKAQIETESITKGRSAKSMTAVAREQWKEEQKYQKSYENDANQITGLAEVATKRELLSYEIFPEPNEKSQFIFEEFGRRFRAGIDELITGLNAKDSPTDTELKRSLESSRARLRPGMRRSSSPLGFSSRSLRGPYMGVGLSEVDSTIVDEICRERATSASVYANAVDLSGYEFWETYQYAGINEAVTNCWYWQLGYWVVEDVVDTVAACNSGSNSVFTSPVKRLSSVSFALGRQSRVNRSVRSIGRGFGRVRRRTDEDKPGYVLSAMDGLAEPCTGRLCNDDIDVIHFNVVVIVSAEAVLPFMERLCSAKEHKFSGFWGRQQEQVFKHNQISILESSWRPVDAESVNHRFYRYGEDAAVELELICEYIFDKAGYDRIKPESIKKALQSEDQTAQTIR